MQYASFHQATRHHARPDVDFKIRRLEDKINDDLFTEIRSRTIPQYEFFWVRTGGGLLKIDLMNYEIKPGNIYCLYPGQLRHIEIDENMKGYSGKDILFAGCTAQLKF